MYCTLKSTVTALSLGKAVCNRSCIPAVLGLWMYFSVISVPYPGYSTLVFTLPLFRGR